MLVKFPSESVVMVKAEYCRLAVAPALVVRPPETFRLKFERGVVCERVANAPSFTVLKRVCCAIEVIGKSESRHNAAVKLDTRLIGFSLPPNVGIWGAVSVAVCGLGEGSGNSRILVSKWQLLLIACAAI